MILGASGAVGGHALAGLLGEFAGVTSIGRRMAEQQHERLIHHVVDLEDPGSYAPLLAGHVAAVCTLGVGEPSKLSREALWRIEVDYVMGFARACREQGVRRFSLMTAVGARVGSRVDYLDMKGTLEQRVAGLGFHRTSVFQPSMLLTPQNRYGVTQAVVLAVWPRLHWLMRGSLRKWRGIPVAELGRAIAVDAARDEPAGVHRYTWDEFTALAARRTPELRGG